MVKDPKTVVEIIGLFLALGIVAYFWVTAAGQLKIKLSDLVA